MKTEYSALRPYANTERQGEILEAVIETGTLLGAARALNCSRSTVQAAIRRIKATAVRRGYSPAHDMTKTVPEGFSVKGVSTLYNSEGDVAAQWVKSNRDLEDIREAIAAYVDELSQSVKPRRAAKAPKNVDEDLAVVYPIGDHHFGMYAAAGDAGGNYDLAAAKAILEDAVDYLVASSPRAKTAILANLGDFLHIDNRTNSTPKSGNALDVDGRYLEICRAAAHTLAHATERLLARHKVVRIVNVPGNHDQDSAGWLSLFLDAWFRNEPRVEVDLSPSDWLFYQFGRNMLCFTHGHKSKVTEIPGVMANLEPRIWGETDYRFAFTGHVHHAQKWAVKEHAGATVESFGILPPADNYAHNLGYRSNQEMHSLTFKRKGGILCRTTFNALTP